MKKAFLVLFLAVNSIASAATYYVAPTGNDTYPGSITQPWLTWQKAFSTAQAGDTVYFRGGVYNIPRTDGYGIRHSPATGQGT